MAAPQHFGSTLVPGFSELLASDVGVAWKEVNSRIEIAWDRADISALKRLWLEYVVGRHADVKDKERRSRRSGFLLFETARAHLAVNEKSDVASPENEELYLEAAHKLGCAGGAKPLIRAAFAATRCAIAFRSGDQSAFPDEFSRAAISYTEFWTDSAFNHQPQLEFDCPLEPCPLSSLRAVVQQCEALRSGYPQLTTGIEMAFRAVSWILEPEETRSSAISAWILMVAQDVSISEGGYGTAARLAVTETTANSCAALTAVPDPIHLGIVTLEPKWKTGFNLALEAIRRRSGQSGRATTYLWHLEFLSADTAKDIQSESWESYLRPAGLTGNSASAAFAILLHHFGEGIRGQLPVSVAAAVNNAHALTTVTVTPKLLGSIWPRFLKGKVSCVIVKKHDSSDFMSHLSSIADDIRPRLLFPAQTLEDAISKSRSWILCQRRKRNFASVAIAAALALPLGYAPHQHDAECILPLRLLVNDQELVLREHRHILNSPNLIRLLTLSDESIKRIERITGPVSEINQFWYWKGDFGPNHFRKIELPFSKSTHVWTAWVLWSGAREYELFNELSPAAVYGHPPRGISGIIVVMYQSGLESQPVVVRGSR